MVRNEKGVWYKHTVIACPMCGREKHYRERMPAPAPPLKWGRYRGIEYIEAWDYCDAL
jgi:hypothetical protein